MTDLSRGGLLLHERGPPSHMTDGKKGISIHLILFYQGPSSLIEGFRLIVWHAERGCFQQEEQTWESA